MKEKLIIKNFAGIDNLELELNQINILFGPQASGKSVCAKLLYYFKNFPFDIFETIIDNEGGKREFDSAIKKRFNEYFPARSRGSSNFLIRYESGNTFIEVKKIQSKPNVKIDYANFYKMLINQSRSLYRKLSNKSVNNALDNRYARDETKKIILEEIQNELGFTSGNNQYFIPAGRSFYANLKKNIFSFISNKNELDPFIVKFGSIYEDIKEFHSSGWAITKDVPIKKELRALERKILKGDYVKEKNKEFIVQLDKRKVEVSNTSSGQQEALPLLTILEIITFATAGKNGGTIYIEEPEAHLFPSGQKLIVDFIAKVFNCSKSPLQFVITTHSPYILTSLNNLLYAGWLEDTIQDDKFEKLYDVVSENTIIQPGILNSFSLHDKTCEKIQCDEYGIIPGDIIDSASDEIAQQFDRLLDLE